MDKELKRIKKLYGEAMMHFCRDNFALILDTPDLLLSILTSNFYPTHELYKDIEGYNLITEFKGFIFKKSLKKEDKIKEAKLSPQKLMAQAGYKLYECLTEDDIQKFRKYYAKDEELCTFWTHRLDKAQVFFAVKKNVKDIKREDFKKPKRQDEYGTSVISIQFTKDDNNTLSIKNRYNHTVEYSDATFSNDLDNIIPGLTDSFELFYGLKQRYPHEGLEIPEYLKALDGKYYKYNYEINNIYYCPDNIIIDNFIVKKYPKEKYLIFDYFILDLEKKEIKNYDKENFDSFPESIGQIKKIEIKKENEEKNVLITPVEGEVIEIKLDKINRMISYKNNNIIKMKDFTLYYNKYLKELYLKNVVEIAYKCLCYNIYALKVIEAPNLKTIGSYFLEVNNSLRMLNFPCLEVIGDYVLQYNETLESFNFYNITTIGSNFLPYNKLIKTPDKLILKKRK